MNPAQVVAALAEHGARIVVEGEAVRLRTDPARPLPADLIAAARANKAGLRVFALSPSAPSPTVPDDLAAGVIRLRAMSAPAGFPSDRWEEARGSALRFAETWAAQALALGWTPLDLFGLHPKAPDTRRDCKGLAFSVAPGETLKLTSESATFTGGLRHYRPRQDAGVVLAWELV